MNTDTERADNMGQAAREKLNQFIARIERLEAEKTELAADIREIYAEIKSFGMDAKIIRKIIAIRKMEPHERAEQEALLEMYMDAVED